MPEPPEFWAFVVTNVFVLLFGGSLLALSVGAYRRSGRSSLRFAAAGFGLITVGSVLDAVYEFGIRGGYDLGGRELLALHTVQTVFVGAGLAVLFLALRRY